MNMNANADLAAPSLIDPGTGHRAGEPLFLRRRAADQAAPMPGILSAEEVATQLGCQPQQINALAAAHALPAVKFGRSWRFPAAALNVFLNQQAMAHVSQPAPVSGTSSTPRRYPAKRRGPVDLSQTVKVV